MKICHIISGLNPGGAEHTLFKLIQYKQDVSIEHIVISLKDKSILGLKLEKLNIKVYELKLNYFNFILKFFLLIRILNYEKPSIVQCWMFHANLFGGVVSKFLKIKRIYWNFRHSNLTFKDSKLKTIIISKFINLLAYYIPDKIILCSKIEYEKYLNKKYKNKILHIPNGVDTSIFKIHKNNNVVLSLGHIGNFRKQKNHKLLFKILSNLKNTNISFVCYLSGQGINKNNINISNLINEFALQDNVILCDYHENVEELYKKFDIFLLTSSSGEAFPNVLIEALSSGIPCISTNIGDSKIIIQDNGFVFEPTDINNFVDKIIYYNNIRLKNLQTWEANKIKCREHVLKNYGIIKIVNLYENEWLNAGFFN